MYTANNLVPNNGYRFRIRAINDLGRGTLASLPSSKLELYIKIFGIPKKVN